MTNSFESSPLPFRIGHGYDLHRLAPQHPSSPSTSTPEQGRPFILGGILLPHTHGPISHSDGDALYHAITDALLGALALPDIGQLFPDTDPRHESQDSAIFLAAARDAVLSKNYTIANIDATIILERPKLSPFKDFMRANIAALLNIPLSNINIKGKTHEKVDAVGEGRAVEVHVVALLMHS